MTEEQAFRLYWVLGVGVCAQSALAWELGSKGVQRLIAEVNERGRPSALVLVAFGAFAIGALWARVGHFEDPYQSLMDAWPVVIAVLVFVLARYKRTRFERSK